MTVEGVSGAGAYSAYASQVQQAGNNKNAAQLLKDLQTLKQTDPAKLKTVLSEIADNIDNAAQKVGGSQGQMLTDLASKFRDAAKTGDLSKLPTPPQQAPGKTRQAQGAGQPPQGGAPPAQGSTQTAQSETQNAEVLLLSAKSKVYNDPATARKELEVIIAQYPNSTEAKAAQQQLARLPKSSA
ncbi:MAG: hypothetical protein ABSE73_02335 [Planctomycetota bacterium]